MPSISSGRQARDERLISLYCSPKFCQRSKRDSQLICEKADDFGWLNIFDPRRGARAGHNTSSSSSVSVSPASSPVPVASTFQKQPELRRLVIIRQSSERHSLTNRSGEESMAATAAEVSTAAASAGELIGDEQTATRNLLAKKQNQRPFSLIVESNVTLDVPSISTNVNHRSCCNLRNDVAAEAPGSLGLSSSSSMNHKSLLSSERTGGENLSRSCGDLRTELRDDGCGSHRGSTGLLFPELQRNSVSQMSLYSGQVSTPTESNITGSRVSLLSEGVDSYEELYEKAYKATYVLGAPSPLSLSKEKVPRDRLVRDWLEKHNTVVDPTDTTTTDVTSTPKVTTTDL